MAGSSLKNAWETATAPNEALDWRGQSARAVNAALSGAAGVAAAGWEAIGAGDMAEGVATAKAVAGLEAIRALPPAAQIEAVQRTGQAVEGFENAYSRAEAAYNRWAQRNPNAAEAVGVAATVGRYAVERGVKSRSDKSGSRTGSSKNEKHGDGGRAQAAAERRIADLQSQITPGMPRAEKKKIQQKISNIQSNAARKAKGEEHGRRGR